MADNRDSNANGTTQPSRETRTGSASACLISCKITGTTPCHNGNHYSRQQFICFPGVSVIEGKRIAVVLPAYNAERTLQQTVSELPDLIDDTILVDDHSSDETVRLARALGLYVLVHDCNLGYGRNQKT